MTFAIWFWITGARLWHWCGVDFFFFFFFFWFLMMGISFSICPFHFMTRNLFAEHQSRYNLYYMHVIDIIGLHGIDLISCHLWAALKERIWPWLWIRLNYHKILCSPLYSRSYNSVLLWHSASVWRAKSNRAIDFDLFNIAAAVLAISSVTWVH